MPLEDKHQRYISYGSYDRLPVGSSPIFSRNEPTGSPRTHSAELRELRSVGGPEDHNRGPTGTGWNAGQAPVGHCGQGFPSWQWGEPAVMDRRVWSSGCLAGLQWFKHITHTYGCSKWRAAIVLAEISLQSIGLCHEPDRILARTVYVSDNDGEGWLYGFFLDPEDRQILADHGYFLEVISDVHMIQAKHLKTSGRSSADATFLVTIPNSELLASRLTDAEIPLESGRDRQGERERERERERRISFWLTKQRIHLLEMILVLAAYSTLECHGQSVGWRERFHETPIFGGFSW